MLPKHKALADNNFNLDENGRKFSKLVENNVGKEEIARYEQFLLFPQCFQRQSPKNPLVLTRKNLVRATGLSFFV